MSRLASPRLHAALTMMILACFALSGCAIAPAAKKAPATTAQAPSVPAVQSPIDTLRGLIDSHQLTELRTTYNATYGASLLFHADTLGYYVALFHGKEFWRVIQTNSFEEAENVYHTFAEQTQKLAELDIETARLDASKKYADRMVAMNAARLQSLQQDAAHQQQQAREVAEMQQQAKQQTASLNTSLHDTNSQLDAIRQQIHALETQEGDPSLALPVVSAPAAATAQSAQSAQVNTPSP